MPGPVAGPCHPELKQEALQKVDVVHVLTKIFIVLVSLLAVLLVPLVVTYAYNENSYQAKYQKTQAQASAASAQLKAAQAAFGAAETKYNSQLQGQEGTNALLKKSLDDAERELRKLEVQLASASDMDQDIRAQLGTLSSAVEAAQNLNNTLIGELRDTRQGALMAQRQRVEIDEALRESQARLDVAEEARRGLEEELQRMKEENHAALADISRYVAMHGSLKDDDITGRVAIDIAGPIDTYIVAVRRTGDRTLAEIGVGETSGIKVGWEVPVGNSNGYVATLRIIEVDINRSVGVIDLLASGARVEVGQQVLIRSNIRR